MMRNNLRNSILAMLLLPNMWGCEQFLEVELPDQEPRLVINALLEPRDTIKVYLSKSRSVLEGRDFDQFEIVDDGMVSIKTEDGTVLPLTFEDKSNPVVTDAYYYLAGHEFEANEEYEIIAESPDIQSISSKVQYPELVPIKDITFENLGQSEGLSHHDLIEFTVKFEDLPREDFYELSGRYDGKSTMQENHFYSGDLYPSPVNPAYENDFYIQSGILFDDILLSGNDSEMVFRSTLPRNVDLEVTIRLSHISESYYQYRQTVGLQNSNRGDFLSQPVLVYTNIENGMGVFKAKNPDQRILKFLLED